MAVHNYTGQIPFYRSFLVLKPGEASFLDIFRLLIFPQGIRSRNRSVDCPEEVAKEWTASFGRRWIIFISLLVQKLLLLVKKPMARLGYLVETTLNLINLNGGLLGLLKNILKGKVVWPEMGSASFVSMIGLVDRRLDLDRDIWQGDPKYNRSLSMMASKLAYENAALVRCIITQHWKMELLGHFNFWNDAEQEKTTGATVFQDNNMIVVAFRGTRQFVADDWRTDADLSWYELEGIGRAHRGFMYALGLQKGKGWPKQIPPGVHKYAYYHLRSLLKEALMASDNMKFVVTGHSLGGALAILFASVLAIHEEDELLRKLEGVYTFGQPRVGDNRFGEFVKQRFGTYKVNYLRYVHCNDVIPRVPPDGEPFMFKHFSPCLFFNSWFYQGKVLPEAPNKNYYSLLWVIPMVLNAIWEFIRGFIIQFVAGPTYRESWILKSMRLSGIAFPGASAHAVQDYVNLTQLGPVTYLESDDGRAAV